MDPALQVFIGGLVIGLMLLAIEVFVPGGVLGMFGAISLLVAVAAGFFAFGPNGGVLAALLLIVFGGIFFTVWIRIFPRTPMGKVLTLQKDGHDFKAAPAEPAIRVGTTGTAQTPLRPAGLAVLGGVRTDVVSEAGFIAAGTAVKVVHIEGHRVVVRAEPS